MNAFSGAEAVQRMRLCCKGKDVHLGLMHHTYDRTANTTGGLRKVERARLRPALSEETFRRPASNNPDLANGYKKVRDEENFSGVFYKVCFSNYTYPKLIYSESSSNTTSQSTAITFNAYRIFLSCNMAVFQKCTIKAFPIVGINSIKAHAIGWSVTLLSLGQPTAPHAHHYALLNILFGKPDSKRDKMLICRNECEEPVSSIKCSPLKKTDGKIALDKSSEANLDYEEQAFSAKRLRV